MPMPQIAWSTKSRNEFRLMMAFGVQGIGILNLPIYCVKACSMWNILESRASSAESHVRWEF